MYQLRTRINKGKEQVFCDWRRKFVRLTPEERVRQTFLHSLVEDYGYPMNLISVEHSICVAGLDKRCDAVVFSRTLLPLCIMEFKAPDVPLTQQVFDQVVVYNRKLQVRYLIVSNGKQTFCCDVSADGLIFLNKLPDYNIISA